jgi:hypothetical protein
VGVPVAVGIDLLDVDDSPAGAPTAVERLRALGAGKVARLGRRMRLRPGAWRGR